MVGERFRMKNPTLAIMTQDGAKIPVMIPKGGEVEVFDGPLNGNRLVDVRWDGKTVMVFTNDVRDRGERLETVGS
jgi:tricorn protease-like protein